MERTRGTFDLRVKDKYEEAEKQRKLNAVPLTTPQNYVTPGTTVTQEVGFMRGHGTYTQDGKRLIASVVGAVERVNRLLTVKTIGGIYYGVVGDVVVGRVMKVTQKRWKVDINSRLDGILPLSSINLPTGELRRRSAEDELGMREILKEGDVISAEIQTVYNDGSLVLHTRSVKYGKLGPGTMLKVSSSLIKRRKNHIHNLPCGASVILGNNGYVWISPLPNGRMPGTNLEEEDPESTQPSLEDIEVSLKERTVVARLRNSICALAKASIPIFDTSVMHAYDVSEKYDVGELLRPDVMSEISELTRLQLAQDLAE